MGFYSEDIIKEVQDRADIIEIISEYTSLQKRGRKLYRPLPISF